MLYSLAEFYWKLYILSYALWCLIGTPSIVFKSFVPSSFLFQSPHQLVFKSKISRYAFLEEIFWPASKTSNNRKLILCLVVSMSLSVEVAMLL